MRSVLIVLVLAGSAWSQAFTEATAAIAGGTVGGVAGFGFRFIDDYNIKVTPEFRYTRWLRSAFSLDSTQSPKNQIEVGFGLTF